MLKKSSSQAPGSCCRARSSYFRARMQLTHPAFLVLDSPTARAVGTQVAEDDRRGHRGRPATTCSRCSSGTSSRSTRPTPRCRPGRSTRACARCSTCWTPIAEPLPESFVRRTESDVRGRGAARHPRRRERARARPRAIERLTYDEARRAAVGAGGAPVQRAERIRPASPNRATTDWSAAMTAAAAVRTDARPARRARRAVGRARRDPPDEPHAAGRGRVRQDDRVGAGDAADGRRRLPVRAARADGSPCRPTCPVDPRRCSGPLAMAGQLGGGRATPPGWRC